jgi:hypothetical protein
MRMPARLTRARYIFAGMVSLLALAVSDSPAQIQDALPDGVSVRLTPEHGKTNYLMGDPIVLRLTLSGDSADYVVNTVEVFGVSEIINVTPADQVFRWHGTISGDLVDFKPMSAAGYSIKILLNEAVQVKNPGTYTISVSTRRVVQVNHQKWLTLTSNPVTIAVVPMPEQEEIGRLAALSKAIAKTDHWDGLDHATEVKLACLEGDRAARKKVQLYLTGRDDILGIRETGLALSRNKQLEIELLDAAWRSPARAPDKKLLDEMILLRHLDAGIPTPDRGMIAPSYTKDQVARAHAETAPYIAEILATMNQRHGDNKSATQAFLNDLNRQNDVELTGTN